MSQPDTTPTAPYRGRFAPSPTGSLHFGSLVAAVASYADARFHRGIWLLRIEDVDGTRASRAAEKRILQQLEACAMHWDDKVLHQSQRTTEYEAALGILASQNLAYRCNCSRKTIASTARFGIEGAIYPRGCRLHPPNNDLPAAWRLYVDRNIVAFDDRIIGHLEQDLDQEIGDFVIRRADGYTAYQLAVVVDDYSQEINNVVRGADLLWSTPRQILLQRLLGYPTPRYAHIPLVYGADGRKLSKSDAALPLEAGDTLMSLYAAWAHLGQNSPPSDLPTTDDFWRWAIPNWRIDRVPHDRSIDVDRANDTL